MSIVYVVMTHYWQKGLSDCPDSYDSYIDSIWSTKDDAKIRVNDLANEYVRQAWYNDDYCNLDDFTVKQDWNEERTLVRNSQDPYEETTYYIDEIKLNTVDEFTGA